MQDLKNNKIVLMGFMGSGKSTVGKILAERLGYEFIDLDHLLESEQKMTISDIFELHGEAYFRTLESRVLEHVLHNKNIVVSLGGGTPCNQNNIELIKRSSTSIYLKMHPGDLMKRLIGQQASRPLIRTFKKKEQLLDFIVKKLSERNIYYEQANHITEGSLTPEEVVSDILCFLEENGQY